MGTQFISESFQKEMERSLELEGSTPSGQIVDTNDCDIMLRTGAPFAIRKD